MTNYNHRTIVQVVVEAQSPLAVYGGQDATYTDALVSKDVNGLPYIPGTSIAGVIRHTLKDAGVDSDAILGNQDEGSRTIFSDALLVGKEGVAVDGLASIDWDDPFYRSFELLPLRQHVKINEKGTAVDGAKFDQEVVYKGARFVFSIEMVSTEKTCGEIEEILNVLRSAELHFGSGSRKGYGSVKVMGLNKLDFNLSVPQELESYLALDSSLSSINALSNYGKYESDKVIRYALTLSPEDFMMFGSGFGDKEVDAVPVVESIIEWEEGKPVFRDSCTLIPASSLKGALRHRVAYHYNRLNHYWAGSADAKAADENVAVRELFGYEENTAERVLQVRGNVLFKDIIECANLPEKIFNHVAIDRFTGGALDGALFSEKATYAKGREFKTDIYLVKKGYSANVVEAFEAALNDLCSRLLPLGGATTKGYGCFTGEFYKEEK